MEPEKTWAGVLQYILTLALVMLAFPWLVKFFFQYADWVVQ